MIDVREIMEIMPHRYPFLLVDRIESLKAGEEIVGIKNVTINEPFFAGHFPGNPIMPGVLIIELRLIYAYKIFSQMFIIFNNRQALGTSD